MLQNRYEEGPDCNGTLTPKLYFKGRILRSWMPFESLGLCCEFYTAEFLFG